jgi:4-hydroxybenzoyl-CoA reductase subunit alpha
MAGEMGLDPVAVRRANFLKAPTFTDNDLMVNSYGLPECIDWVERESGWKERKGKLAGEVGRRKGLGFACSHYISGASKPVNWTGEPHATVKLKLDFDGSIVVLTGAADIGQGSSTVLVQTVAEVLGLDISRVRIVTGDSDVVPKDNGSYSSRVTFIVGNAAIDAANRLKGHRVPGRGLPRGCTGQGADVRGGGGRGAEGQRHHHCDRHLLHHP